MRASRLSQETFLSWRAIEGTGVGDSLCAGCERRGKPGTARQQFRHISVDVCYICARERSDELQSEGSCA